MAHQYTTMVLGWIDVVNNVQPCRCSANGMRPWSDVVVLSGMRMTRNSTFHLNVRDPLESLTKLNMCISDIRVWMIKNKFKINNSKTEFIIFRSPLLKQNLSDLSISVGDSQVFLPSKMRDLCVVFDQYLTFHDHISGICRYTHFHLRSIGRIWNLLTFYATAQLIHALFTTRLDFCNSILYNLPNIQIERLQRTQNQAARMLKRIPRRNHITSVLRELHWLKIHDRIILKFLLLTHKAVNNTAPEYLCDLVRFNVKKKSTTIRTCASFDPCLLCVPPISKMCANSFFDRSFMYAYVCSATSNW